MVQVTRIELKAINYGRKNKISVLILNNLEAYINYYFILYLIYLIFFISFQLEMVSTKNSGVAVGLLVLQILQQIPPFHCQSDFKGKFSDHQTIDPLGRPT